MSVLDNQIVEMACPNCGKKFKKPLRWFKVNHQPCPQGCGVTFETDQFRVEIAKVERQLANLLRGL